MWRAAGSTRGGGILGCWAETLNSRSGWNRIATGPLANCGSSPERPSQRSLAEAQRAQRRNTFSVLRVLCVSARNWFSARFAGVRPVGPGAKHFVRPPIRWSTAVVHRNGRIKDFSQRHSAELSAISFQRSASGEPRHDRSVGQSGMKNLCAAQRNEELVVQRPRRREFFVLRVLCASV